jgi:hypothetical protein
MTCPIALTTEDGNARLHQITAPIVEGSGADLPGLLGLRSLEHERAILDCGSLTLHLVGQGEVQLVLPPGSMSIPLQKAPSGHLVMVIDDFEKVSQSSGGLPEASLQLHAETAPARPSEPQEADPTASGSGGDVAARRSVSFNL